LASVDHTDGLHTQCGTGSRLDPAERDVKRSIARPAVESLTHFLDFDAQRLGHQSELPLPLAGDGAREADTWLVVERPPESQGVAHDVYHRVVVVQSDLVGVDILD